MKHAVKLGIFLLLTTAQVALADESAPVSQYQLDSGRLALGFSLLPEAYDKNAFASQDIESETSRSIASVHEPIVEEKPQRELVSPNQPQIFDPSTDAISVKISRAPLSQCATVTLSAAAAFSDKKDDLAAHLCKPNEAESVAFILRNRISAARASGQPVKINAENFGDQKQVLAPVLSKEQVLKGLTIVNYKDLPEVSAVQSFDEIKSLLGSSSVLGSQNSTDAQKDLIELPSDEFAQDITPETPDQTEQAPTSVQAGTGS